MDEVFDKRRDVKEAEKRLEKKLERMQQEIDDIENQIVEVTVKLSLEKECENTEQELESLSDEVQWLDWMEKFGETLKVGTSSEAERVPEGFAP